MGVSCFPGKIAFPGKYFKVESKPIIPFKFGWSGKPVSLQKKNRARKQETYKGTAGLSLDELEGRTIVEIRHTKPQSERLGTREAGYGVLCIHLFLQLAHSPACARVLLHRGHRVSVPRLPLMRHYALLQVLVRACMHSKLLQSCPTLCDPMDCNPPGSSVHGILQARILEAVALPSSKGSS